MRKIEYLLLTTDGENGCSVVSGWSSISCRQTHEDAESIKHMGKWNQSLHMEIKKQVLT